MHVSSAGGRGCLLRRKRLNAPDPWPGVKESAHVAVIGGEYTDSINKPSDPVNLNSEPFPSFPLTVSSLHLPILKNN